MTPELHAGSSIICWLNISEDKICPIILRVARETFKYQEILVWNLSLRPPQIAASARLSAKI